MFFDQFLIENYIVRLVLSQVDGLLLPSGLRDESREAIKNWLFGKI